MIHGFSEESLLHRLSGKPIEDSHNFSYGGEIAMAVADGITRDFKDSTPLMRDFKSFFKLAFDYYPNPSPAKQIADAFTNGFITLYGEKIENRFSLLNSGFIRGLNSRNFPNPDYLANDFAGCVASGAVVRDRDLFYGFIADCGVAVFNAKGDIIFTTPNEGPNSKGSIDKDIAEKFNASFRDMRGRMIIRSGYRNNPENSLAYGALTGQQEALKYIRTGHRELKNGELVLLFTDGLESAIFKDGMKREIYESAFASALRNGAENRDFSELKRFCRKRISSEGTAVIYLTE